MSLKKPYRNKCFHPITFSLTPDPVPEGEGFKAPLPPG